MKPRIFHLVLFSAFLLLVGCSDEETLDHLKVTAVQNLFDPTDNKTVTLTTTGSLVFEWEAAKAEDGGMVLYEIAFDKVGGDFSTPLYTMTSDNGGSYNYATVAHTTLDKIAKKLGLNKSETGKIIWTVIASKGINEVRCAKTNTLEITRLAGYADSEIPANLFITGEGTEGGTDLSKAIQLKQTGAGVFEIYTKLTEGKTYNFSSTNTGTPNTYYIDASGSTLKQDGSSTAPKTSVYRIKIDFSTGAVSMTEIQKLSYFFSPWWDGGSLFDFEYQGNGVWKASNEKIEFNQEEWGVDERYKFYFTLGDGTLEWWDSNVWDNGQPNASTAATYYNLYSHYTSADAVDALTDDIVYGYSFKWAEKFKDKNVNITVSFAPNGAYTHKAELVTE